MAQKPYTELIVRIYQNKQGENLIKKLNSNEAVKDCTLVGASNISLAKIKYAHERQINEELSRKFKEIDEAY